MSSLSVPCPQCGKSLRLRDRSLLGRRVKCPGCEQEIVLTAPQPQRDTTARESPTGASSSADTGDVIPSFEPSDSAAGINRLRDIKRKNRRRRNGALFVAALVAGGFAAFLFTVWDKVAPEQISEEPASKKVVSAKASSDESTELAADAIAASPTDGEAIKLTMIPAGARIVIHLRPAELWQSETTGEECLRCLGPLRPWAEAMIRELSGFEPAELAEMLICLIPGPRGTAPDVAAVVRLAEAQKRSDLLLKFGGRRSDEHGVPVYIDGERVYLIDDDLMTFAVAPAKFAGEIAGSVKFPNPTSPGVEAMLPHTDRRRHVTVIFDPIDVRLHADALFPTEGQAVVNVLLDWLGEDAETVVCSAHLSDEFFCEVLLRNRDAREQRQFLSEDLLAEMQEKLGDMPRQVLTAVERMQPAPAGRRRVIGRFPAMMKAVALTTRGEASARVVRLATALPERAGPNLALGASLTWDEAERTDFTRPSESSAEPADVLPDRIADRLKRPIEVDFRRTPLEEALTYIGTGTGVRFEIEGDALKAAGYTKNMEQNLALGKVPAVQALREILQQYEQMAVVVDDQVGRAIVTTQAAAQEKGMEAYLPAP